jgi:hypothetical protein
VRLARGSDDHLADAIRLVQLLDARGVRFVCRARFHVLGSRHQGVFNPRRLFLAGLRRLDGLALGGRQLDRRPGRGRLLRVRNARRSRGRLGRDGADDEG